MTATIARTGVTTAALVVDLSTSHATDVWVPAQVTIPAGAASTVIAVEVINDEKVDGDKVVTITAAATGFGSGTTQVQVKDDDTLLDRTIGGRLSGTLASNTYRVLSKINVVTATQWIIDAGSVLRFAPGVDIGLQVDGTVTAMGTSNSPIRFTSNRATPAPGDWSGITISSKDQPRSVLSHVLVEYGSNGVSVLGADEPQLTVADSEFRFQSEDGIRIEAGRGDFISAADVSIENNRIHHNGNVGISVMAFSSAGNPSASASPLIYGNEIHDNVGVGISISANYSVVFGISSSASASPKVDSNWIHHNAGGIQNVATASSASFRGSDVDGLFVNNLIDSNSGPGIDQRGGGQGSAYSSVINNTIIDNQGAGIVHPAEGINQISMKIWNNIVMGNANGIEARGPFAPQTGNIGFNNVFGNLGANWVEYPSSFGTLIGSNARGVAADNEMNTRFSPEFLTNSRYHLQTESLLVNAGMITDLVTQDVDGDRRFAAPDVGYDEVPQLRVTFSPDWISEGAGDAATSGLLERNTINTSQRVDAVLSSSNTTAARVPGSVSILPGNASVQFPVSAVDDFDVDGPQTTVVTAAADGLFTSPGTMIFVEDDEPPQAIPVGGEVAVSPLSSFGEGSPSIAMAADGSYVIAHGSASGVGFDVFLQPYSSSGQPSGPRILVNTTTAGTQNNPSVAMAPDGRYVVVWEDQSGTDGSLNGIYGQRFAANHTKVGGQFLVNETTDQSQSEATVGMAADGSFLVAWHGNGIGDAGGVFARQYNATGVPLTGEFLVNTETTSGGQGSPKVAMNARGESVIVWLSNTIAFGKRYDFNGTPIGVAFRLSSSNTASPSFPRESFPSVAIRDSGEFVAAWTANNVPRNDIFVRAFDASGNPRYPAVQANSLVSSNHTDGKVAIAADGGFVATWTSVSQDGSSNGVYARQFHASAFPLSDEWRVNTTTTGDQRFPDLAMQPKGDFVITWQGFTVGDSSAVLMQRYRQPLIDPVVRWNKPATIAFGTALSNSQLNAASEVPGTFTYSPSLGTKLNAGFNQELKVTFTPTDKQNFNPVTTSVFINVSKADPVVTWTDPAEIIFGTSLSTTQLNAVANTAGQYIYSPAIDTVLNAGSNQELSVIFLPTDTNNFNNITKNVVINVAKATPVVTWSKPDDIVFGTMLSSAQLNAKTTTPGTFIYTPTFDTLLNAGSGQELSVTFVPTDATNFNPANQTTKINVGKATPIVAWKNPDDVIVGTLLSAKQLNATSTTPGTFVYMPSFGKALDLGLNQDLSVTFFPTDTANFEGASKTVKVNVVKDDPVVIWENPANILVGTSLSATQLNASSDIAGAFVYEPTIGTVLAIGANEELRVTFTPADITTFNIVTKSVRINVVAPTLDYGDAPTGYPVMLAQDGARHTSGSLFLGTAVDAEVNGVNSISSDADGGDDDGVIAVASFVSTNVATTSSFSVIASGPGKLDGWIDFNNDGDWLDAGEQIFTSTSVVAGNNLLSFTVPANSTSGSTGARFRLSTAGALAPTGAAVDGEVEDYLAAIITGSSSAVLDIDVPGGNTNVIVEGDSLVVRKGAVVISKVPFANFGSLKLNGSSLDDILQLTILESLANQTLEFDGGLGKDFLELVEAGKTLDLTDTRVTLRDVEGIDVRGSGNNKLVISIDKVKAASTSTDTLEVVANAGDSVSFGAGWKAETPQFINGVFTHIISETASGGTARVEIRNDRLLTNPLTPFDADRDGKIQALDALRIINELSRRGSGAFTLPTKDSEISKLYFDVNADNRLTALDALRIINAIARINRGGNAEGEAAAAATPTTAAPVDLNLFNNQPAVSLKATAVMINEIVTPKVLLRPVVVGAATQASVAAIDDLMASYGVGGDSDEGDGLQLLSSSK